MVTVHGVLTRCRVQFALALLLLLGALPFAVAAPRPSPQALEATQTEFRLIHDQVEPAVVSITSSMQEQGGDNMDMFDFFFGRPQTPRMTKASGSGVIIRDDGIVLTNAHVVANATKVTVTLAGTEKALPAEVVQTDPRTDLAIVRITQKGTYKTAVLGDASKVHVGDWAIAFGSPFRLASTMTVGVISATGRQLRAPDEQFTYRDLLQTDASINPGNSGGPLANIYGEVVGINCMIYSPGDNAGSVGIGFAIPLNDYTKNIITTLTSGRAVERGLLGIIVKNLDDAMRQQYDVPDGGILVDHVMPGQAAATAGIKDEDVITAFNNVKVTDIDQFVKMVEVTPPGTKAPVAIVRAHKAMTLVVTVGSAIPAKTAKANIDDQKTGMTVTNMTSELAQHNQLQDIPGALVTRVAPGSPADDAGLRPGDIIVRVDGDEVKTADEFWGALNKNYEASANKVGVLLRVQRGAMPTTLSLPPLEEGKKPQDADQPKATPKLQPLF